MMYLAVKISNFARDGELKVHLREEIIDVRKEEGLLPFRSSPILRTACQFQADHMAKNKTLTIAMRENTKQSLEQGGVDAQAAYMEVGSMPPSLDYLSASKNILEAAKSPNFNVSGFAQSIGTDQTTYFCYILGTERSSH